jgi:AraC-like DNA-binding protein
LLGHVRSAPRHPVPALPVTAAGGLLLPAGIPVAFGVPLGGYRMAVSTVMVRILVDAVEWAGVSRDELLRPLKIDEALGFHIAERTPDSAFDLIGHLVSHAPTLREALSVCAQFQRLIMDDTHITLSETGASATLHHQFGRTFERSDRMQGEFVVAAFLRFIRVFGGPSVAPQVASFEHARPAHHAEYVRLFGDVVRFSQRETKLTFDRALLDRPQLHQNPGLYSVLRTQAERVLERVAPDTRPADQVGRYLRARPPAKIPDLSTAAKDLGLSARSLRRRLAEDATSYRLLVRATLEASAGHMLLNPMHSIQETAHAMGFSNVGAFHRAFKRWTGMTPAQYRERRGGHAGEPEKQ